MNIPKLTRAGLLIVQAFVAATAIAGGLALILGALVPSLATVLGPPTEYLDGSPFASYLVPGLLLAGLLGGVHVVAFALLLKRNAWQFIGAAAAGFALLIWVFVQMIFIPFSFLQLVYFAFGIAEVGLVMLALGLVTPASDGTFAPASARRRALDLSEAGPAGGGTGGTS